LKRQGEQPAQPGLAAEERTEYAVVDQEALQRALAIDETVRHVRPDDWRDVYAREQVIKRALYDILKDVAEVERIFLIIKAQKEY
jgi:type I restriction enzyme R subunit